MRGLSRWGGGGQRDFPDGAKLRQKHSQLLGWGPCELGAEGVTNLFAFCSVNLLDRTRAAVLRKVAIVQLTFYNSRNISGMPKCRK